MPLEEDAPRKKGGRPRKYASDTKNPTLTFRVRGGLYEKLQKSSELNDRSLSEEIEYRLSETFSREAAAGDPRTRAVGDAVMATILIEEARAERPWHSDDSTSRLALARVVHMLSVLMGVKPARDIAEGEERDRARILEAVGSVLEDEYALPYGLGGAPYRDIRDAAALRWMRHNPGEIDLLIKESLEKRETVRKQEGVLETNEDKM